MCVGGFVPGPGVKRATPLPCRSTLWRERAFLLFLMLFLIPVYLGCPLGTIRNVVPGAGPEKSGKLLEPELEEGQLLRLSVQASFNPHSSTLRGGLSLCER